MGRAGVIGSRNLPSLAADVNFGLDAGPTPRRHDHVGQVARGAAERRDAGGHPLNVIPAKGGIRYRAHKVPRGDAPAPEHGGVSFHRTACGQKLTQ